MALKVRDVTFPSSPAEILDGVAPVVQLRNTKTGVGVRADDSGSVLRPQQVTILDTALALVMWALCSCKRRTERIFGGLSPDRWRRLIAKASVVCGLGHLRIVPRCLRAGDTTFLYVSHYWGLAELVARGRWARYGSTAAYLNAGLYAAMGLEVPVEIRSRARRVEKEWPRMSFWPESILSRFGSEIRSRFVPVGSGSGGWGREMLSRRTEVEDAPRGRLPRGQ